MVIKKFPVNPFPVNTYILHDEDTKECAIIDPGCYWGEEFDQIDSYIERNDLKVKYVLLTHLHLDHALAVPYFAKKYNVDFCANSKDAFLLQNAPAQAAQYGLQLQYMPIAITKELNEGDVVKLGDKELNIFEVPGHTPGSVAFYSKDLNAAIVGDVLFLGSIGRTDLPGGDYATLIDSIKTKLFTLPDDTLVYSGHGPETNIKYEKNNNPFVR